MASFNGGMTGQRNVDSLPAVAENQRDKVLGLIRLNAYGLRIPETWVLSESGAEHPESIQLPGDGPWILRPSLRDDDKPAQLSGILPSPIFQHASGLREAVRRIRHSASAASVNVVLLIQRFVKPDFGGILHVRRDFKIGHVALTWSHPVHLAEGTQDASLEYWLGWKQPLPDKNSIIASSTQAKLVSELPGRFHTEMWTVLTSVMTSHSADAEVEWLYDGRLWCVQLQDIDLGHSERGRTWQQLSDSYGAIRCA